MSEMLPDEGGGLGAMPPRLIWGCVIRRRELERAEKRSTERAVPLTFWAETEAQV